MASSGTKTYDAFVSFRGEDIRKSFMDHLFSDFRRKGIHAFRDDEQLKRGEEISPGLYKAIEESRFLIVIFSNNYASSTWCLRELVKILECKEMAKDEYEVRTIFYDVKPAVVRNQTGSYAEAFSKHEASKKVEVSRWKEALTRASDLSGWDLQDMANGYESKFIDIISKEIFEKLSDGHIHVGENLVGLHSRVEKMNLLHFIGSSEVNMIAVCGISGVGKTTIAKAVYNMLYHHFEGYSFCEDVKSYVKSYDIVHLQKQLLDDVTDSGMLKIRSVGEGIRILKQRMGSKRVLIVLDDVDHRNQLQALAGARNWFGPGSLIIFTTRDRQLLNAHGVEDIYEVDFLNHDEGLELFSLYAFNEKHPKPDFIKLAERVVQYVKGHPLALIVLGGFLYGKTVFEWESELNKLSRYPNSEIQEVLRLSYNALDRCQQSIFLNIACFFKGSKKEFVAEILDACNLYSDTNIRVLIDRFLISISYGRLQMHDLLQEMGREVVREESEEPGERSRLWFPKEVCNVLSKDMGTKAVKGLALDLSSSEVHVGGQTFAQMSNVQLLNLYFRNNSRDVNVIKQKQILREGSDAGPSGSLEFLSNELRWLRWHGYPFQCLPKSFYPESLVALDMSYSNIKQLWIGSKGFVNLARMKLRHCHNLTETPDFSEIPNLRKLILEGCTNLADVHPSVGLLKSLAILNLKDCRNLRSFPSIIRLESLQILILAGCSQVNKLLEDLHRIKTSRDLQVDGTNIKQLPSSLNKASSNENESLRSPLNVVLPSLSSLSLLKQLDISRCNLSEAHLDSISCLSLLEGLNLSANDFATLPACFGQLSRLKELGLVGCKKLQALPELPPSIISIDAQDCTYLRELSKPSIMYKSNCLNFNFGNCPKLIEHTTINNLSSMLLPQLRIEQDSQLNVLLPGSNIPDWFSNQSVGDCIKVELPAEWNYQKFRGFATCAVLVPKTHPNGLKQRFQVGVEVQSLHDAYICGIVLYAHSFPSEARCEMDQIWLSYWAPNVKWRYLAKEYIEALFQSCSDSSEVRKCGIRLFYDEGDEGSSSRMLPWLSSSSDDANIFYPNWN